jgi:predicted site-specific integrase-resolvase
MNVVFGYQQLSNRLPGVSIRTLRRLVAAGAIPFRRLSGKVVVFDLDAVQKALMHHPASQR